VNEMSFPSEAAKPKRSMLAVIVVTLLIGLLIGASAGFYLEYCSLNGEVKSLQAQMNALALQGAIPAAALQNATYLVGDNVSLAVLYQKIAPSVVIVRGWVPQYSFFHLLKAYTQVQGSGFVTAVNGRAVVVTNYHVVSNAENMTVTFNDGNAYASKVLGADPYADLAVLSLSSLPDDAQPLTVVSSRTLQVGDPVVAVGSPYGLAGSVTTGIISALGRTITEDLSGGVPIADVIQTSTPINPGNSGGPLVNYRGEVVGITTAIVSNSQGIGFAIPSSTILREIASLVANGGYNDHPSLGVTVVDMTFELAQAMGVNVTYGCLVQSVSTSNGLKGGTRQANVAGSTVTLGGDIIVALNGSRIVDSDSLFSYLEENTLPGQTLNVTVVRDGQTMTVPVTVGRLST